MPIATPQGTLAAGGTPRRSASTAASPVPRLWASRSHAAVSTPARANQLPRTPSRSVASTASGLSKSMRIGQKVEEMQLAAAACQAIVGLPLQHDREQAVVRIEDQEVQCPLCAGAACGGIFLERKLEEGVELHR